MASALWVVSALVAAMPAPAQAPVHPGSAAWNAVADLPLRVDETLQHGAPALLARWGHPDTADAVRRHLLLRHWQAAAGAVALPEPGERLRQLLGLGAPPSVDELDRARSRALDRALRIEAAGSTPPVDHLALQAVPAVPGLWAAAGATKGHGLGAWRVTNTAPVGLALPAHAMTLAWGRDRVPVRCGLQPALPVLAPGRSAVWVCALDAPVPRGAEGLPRFEWALPSLVSEAQRAAEAEALASPSARAALARLAAQHAGCDAQNNCSAEQRDAMARREAARTAERAEAAARHAAQQAEQQQAHRAAERWRMLGVLGLLLLGQVVVTGMARTFGSLWPGRLVVTGVAAVAAVGLVREAAGMGRDSLAPLVVGGFGLAVVPLAWALLAVYEALHRRWGAGAPAATPARAPARGAQRPPRPVPLGTSPVSDAPRGPTTPRTPDARAADPIRAGDPSAPAAPSLACPHCADPLAALRLAGHYGTEVQVDHCDRCRLLWFDQGELARLSGRGWTALLHRLAQHAGDPAAPPARALAPCPHCASPLRAVHDQTLFGRFTAQACPRGHGSAQRDVDVFAARGLFRRLHALEVPRLAAQAVSCLACGAPREAGDAKDCRYCASPPMVVDVHRLSQSLGLRRRATTLGQGRLAPWHCAGCGHPVDAVAESRCGQCSLPVVAPRLEAVQPLLEDALQRPDPTPEEQRAARSQQMEALIAHERQKAEWDRSARPRSPVMRLLLGAVRVLGRRD